MDRRATYRQRRAAATIASAWRNSQAAQRVRMIGMRQARLGQRLARNAIASRIHQFRRVTDAFGFRSAVGGAGTTYIDLVNCGSTPNQLFSFANVSPSSFTASSYQFGASLQFMLAHVSNVTEIVNLFDNYRIKYVSIKIVPGFNSVDMQGNAITGSQHELPTMHYTIDNDDATVPANRTAVLENSYAKSIRLDKPFTITLKPRAQNVVATTAGAQSAGMLPATQWLDSSSQTIPHFGLKMWFDEWPVITAANSAAACLKFIVTYSLECKNVV